MKISAIKLINTLNKYEKNQLVKTQNDWIYNVVSSHSPLQNFTKKVKDGATYIIDGNDNILICNRVHANRKMKTATIGDFLFSFIRGNNSTSKVISSFSSAFEKLPDAVKNRLFPLVKKTNKGVSVDYHQIKSLDGKVDKEDIVFSSSKGTGFISRDKHSVNAKVFDSSNNLVYLGRINNEKLFLYEDMKKDVFDFLK